MLETRDLTKVYNESVLAVNKLNLKVDDGEIYVVLGANGAGKSTTISMLLNFIEPTSGTALIGDIEIPKFPLEAKKHLAYVSENVELYRNFTARQNLSFFAKLGGRKKVSNEELDETLDALVYRKKPLRDASRPSPKGCGNVWALPLRL